MTNLKSWSNFRLMLLVGGVITALSLLAGGAYVQASLSGQEDEPAETGGQGSSDQGQANNEADPAPPRSLGQGGSAVTEIPLPGPDAGEDFSVFCPAGDGTATQNTCRVRSYSGFDDAVSLSCTGTPPGIGCAFSPATVTPPAGGSAVFTLSILVSDQVEPGGHVFNVVGRGGGLTNSYRYPLLLPSPPQAQDPGQPVTAPQPPDPAEPAGEAPNLEPSFTIACSLNPGPETVIDKLLWSLSSGAQGTVKCIVKPVNGFNEQVRLELTNVNGDLTYEFDPPIVIPAPASPSPGGPTISGSTFFDINFVLGSVEDGAEYSFDVTGVSESMTTTRRVILTVTDQG